MEREKASLSLHMEGKLVILYAKIAVDLVLA